MTFCQQMAFMDAKTQELYFSLHKNSGKQFLSVVTNSSFAIKTRRKFYHRRKKKLDRYRVLAICDCQFWQFSSVPGAVNRITKVANDDTSGRALVHSWPRVARGRRLFIASAKTRLRCLSCVVFEYSVTLFRVNGFDSKCKRRFLFTGVTMYRDSSFLNGEGHHFHHVQEIRRHAVIFPWKIVVIDCNKL